MGPTGATSISTALTILTALSSLHLGCIPINYPIFHTGKPFFHSLSTTVTRVAVRLISLFTLLWLAPAIYSLPHLTLVSLLPLSCPLSLSLSLSLACSDVLLAALLASGICHWCHTSAFSLSSIFLPLLQKLLSLSLSVPVITFLSFIVVVVVVVVVWLKRAFNIIKSHKC